MFSSSEQNKDFGEACQKQDADDLGKLIQRLNIHPPVLRNKEIVSIVTGVMGDNITLCHDAVKIG